MAKFNVQSIAKSTNRQGLVSQVDREVLVIHLYHLDLKIEAELTFVNYYKT